jgi:adenine-specific DNA-methyltransferase
VTEQEARQRLQQCLLDLLPANGSMVGNGSLLAQWTQAALAAGLTATAEDFTSLREDLVARGLVVKGKGRGGSTGRAAGAAAGSDSFALQGEAPTPVDAADAAARPKANTATAPKTQRLRAADADEPAQVLSYRHNDRRKNNPEVGLVSEASDPQQPKQTWAYNPHLDPVLNFDSARAELETLIDDALASGDAQAAVAALEEIKRRGAPYLQWAGKAERTSFEVDTVSLHVHERIDPMSILSAVRKRLEEATNKSTARLKAEEPSPLARQASLFEAPFENLPLRSAVDFYRHDKGWANRLVAGDSLLVMNSLLVKESMAGQVQMIYIDPPYGIKYGSNFQPFVGKRDVKDRSDADLTQEPEMIKAFRDTWELGIHSYLTYLRDRLLVASELLSESGSVFIQISDENLHHVREIADEVFGPDNFVALVTFRKTSAVSSPNARVNVLGAVADYLVWYARDIQRVKYRQLYVEKSQESDNAGVYKWSEAQTGKRARGAAAGGAARVFRVDNITSSGWSENLSRPISFQGSECVTAENRHWATHPEGMTRLGKVRRLVLAGRSLGYVRDSLKKVHADWRGALSSDEATDPCCGGR